jgi:hypothetical protein
MSDKYKNSPKNRPTPAQPTHVLIKIAGGCLILASIAAIAVEIRGWIIEPGNTQEYLSQEIRDRVSSKPSWHYTDPIEHRGKDSDSASKEQLPPSDGRWPW